MESFTTFKMNDSREFVESSADRGGTIIEKKKIEKTERKILSYVRNACRIYISLKGKTKKEKTKNKKKKNST